jgi:CDP-glucose 4,6-dehydratase
MGVSDRFWAGRKVFLTGHTGFKGAWLALYLEQLGAEVFGFSLDPATQPNLFERVQLEAQIHESTIGDIREQDHLSNTLRASEADTVFHLAAQALVRESYAAPIETLATNAMGTAHVLEAIRNAPSVRAAVIITTDKVYENLEQSRPHLETDPLGGYDPYSASKACAELITDSYRNSFLRKQGIHVATARAGNVIGGGDWGKDRLLPDIIAAVLRNEAVCLRNPNAIRPWQHVLDPLRAYLLLAQNLHSKGDDFATAWNFGPSTEQRATVANVTEQVVAQLGGPPWQRDKDAPSAPHETKLLSIDSSKAIDELGWRPVWALDETLLETTAWYQADARGDDMLAYSLASLQRYRGNIN